jgi:adenylate cyclase
MTDQTFLFADLSGFTALTEVHGDEQAADLAAEFAAEVRGRVAEYSAELVKTIGDAVMIRCEDTTQAVRLGLFIVRELGERHGSPSIRVGMDSGQAIERDGDWFGTTVNVAARVAGIAASGEVLLTEATRNGLGRGSEFEIHERGRRPLRNVAEPVMLYEARAQGERAARGLPIDPVCRMAVDPEHGAGCLTHGGVTFYFCSLQCAARFAADPDRYAFDAVPRPDG